MSATRRTRLAVMIPVLVLLQGVACDPMGPGAVGMVSLSPEAGAAGGRTLEVRAFPEDGTPFVGPGSVLAGRVGLLRASRPLEAAAFPLEYGVGGSLGTTEHERWRVVIWIAQSEQADEPRSGEWYGTDVFTIDDCGLVFPGYCGMALDLAIEIDRRVP